MFLGDWFISENPLRGGVGCKGAFAAVICWWSTTPMACFPCLWGSKHHAVHREMDGLDLIKLPRAGKAHTMITTPPRRLHSDGEG